MTPLLRSMWQNFRPFPSIWLKFSHIELWNSVFSRKQLNPQKFFFQCMGDSSTETTWLYLVGLLNTDSTVHCRLSYSRSQKNVYFLVFLVASQNKQISRILAKIHGWILNTPCSLTFFFRVFGDLWDTKEWWVLLRSFLKNVKECKERNVLLQRT